tara:strand:+ start:52626 stop:53393 length:768 start_codon:yes stop_codon:yes gene_type:complete
MIQAKKQFGQNFLQDESIIQKIVTSIHPASSDHMVEIGPGLGALTTALAEHVNRLDVIEIDQDLIPELSTRLKACDITNTHITHADALTFDYAQLTDTQIRVVGNLPYNISTPLLFHLLKVKSQIIDMHFMLQKEVVDRICAEPGSKQYGRLTIMVQYHCQATPLFFVPPTAFYPRPKVDSAIVRLKPHTDIPYLAKDETLFSHIVRDAFNQRRKTLRNCLKPYKIDYDQVDINPQQRPEQLSVQDYVTLANHVL